MAGAYCKYCDQRCFVYREVIAGRELVWALAALEALNLPERDDE